MTSTDSLCTCRLACFECDLTGEWHTHDEPCPIHPESPISEINIPRCSYSDLPERDCSHCNPGQRTPTGKKIPRPVEPAGRPYLAPVERHDVRTLPDELENYETVDYITALCDWTRHSEQRVTLHRQVDGSMTNLIERHNTENPPLIEQLWSAVEGSRGLDVGNKSFGSQPSARLEALDVVNDIEREVHRILKHEHRIVHSHDLYPETIDAVRHLGAVATKDQAKTIRRWWATARVVTGWDLPAFKPDNTCPLCAKRGSLRIKYPTAFCVECRSHWDDETIGLLVEHVRVENHEDDDAGDTPEVETA